MTQAIIYPPALKPGDTIGVTAPSAGVAPELEPRLQFCLQAVRQLGYGVAEGRCLRSAAMASAPARERARELADMLQDDTIHAVIPPWGGELLMDILPLLDFAALARARPKWIVGYSDLSTFMLPYTLLTHIATAHGSNLMETPNRPVDPIAHWNDVVRLSAGATLRQSAASQFQVAHFDWATQPAVTDFNRTQPVQWNVLHHEGDKGYQVSVSGRLIGGCLDVVGLLAGTRFGDLNTFARDCAPEGLLVYLENCDGNSAQMCRMLHHVRFAGWLDHANAVLIGRSAGPDLREFTTRDALLDAFGDLDVPILYDLDIGHQPPQLMLVNGAQATVVNGPSERSVTQWLA